MSGEELKIIVEADLLPEVLLKVIEAKKLLSQGKAKNSSEAARMAGISRSAYYKYKDGVAVYDEEQERRLVTYYLTLMDVPGVLSNVLAELSKYGANGLQYYTPAHGICQHFFQTLIKKEIRAPRPSPFPSPPVGFAPTSTLSERRSAPLTA